MNDDVTRGARVPPAPGQHKEEPEPAQEDDIPSEDHDADGTQPRDSGGDPDLE